MFLLLLIVVCLLVVAGGARLGLAYERRQQLPSVDTRALDNPPLDPATLTGQAYFDWEHAQPNPYEKIKHLPGQGCIRCYPPPRGSLPVTPAAPGTHAITNTPATPLYRQGGSDLSISIDPRGAVAWEQAPAHLREFSPYLMNEWNEHAPTGRVEIEKPQGLISDPQAEARQRDHEEMLREERVKALVDKVHKYGLGVLTPEVITDLSMADYAALRPYLMEDWVLHTSPNKERARASEE